MLLAAKTLFPIVLLPFPLFPIWINTAAISMWRTKAHAWLWLQHDQVYINSSCEFGPTLMRCLSLTWMLNKSAYGHTEGEPELMFESTSFSIFYVSTNFENATGENFLELFLIENVWECLRGCKIIFSSWHFSKYKNVFNDWKSAKLPDGI